MTRENAGDDRAERKRLDGLKANGTRLFWAIALLSVNTFGVFSTIFYLQRGLTLAQVFYTGVVWAAVSLLSETPSSYLADRWGRKRMIFAGIALAVGSSVVLIAFRGVWSVMASFVLSALAFSCISGTDEALIYDTKLELGERGQTLSSLSKLMSAKYVFKIVVPLLAAIVAKDLTEAQSVALLLIDLSTSIGAAVVALGLVEPFHKYEVVQQEAGLWSKAWAVLRDSGPLKRAILSRAAVMAAGLTLWRYHQKMFVDLGVTPLALGAAWALFHLILVAYYRSESPDGADRSLERRIDGGNAWFLASVLAFIAAWYWLHEPYLLLALFMAQQFTDVARWPKYSEFFNRHAASFNRATTLSLANALKSVLDIPFMLIAARLSVSPVYPWWFAAVVALAVIWSCRLSGFGAVKNRQQT